MEKFLCNTIKTGLLLVLLSVLLYFNSSMYPFLTLKTVVIQSIIEILTACWLALIIFYPQHRPRFTPVSIGLLILLVVLLISSFWGADFYKSFWSTQSRLTGVFLIIHIILLFFIASSVAASFWCWLWWASLGAAFAGTAFGAIEKFLVHNLFHSQDYGRASSLFGNPSFLAGYLLFNVFIGLWLTTHEHKKWAKIIAAIFTAAVALGVFLTQTIGALAGLAAGGVLVMVYYAFKLPPSRKKNMLIGLLALAVIFNVVFWTTRSSAFWNYFPGLGRIARVDLLGNVHNRFIAWQSGWQAWQERPLLGYGWENFNVAFNKYYNPILLTSTFTETYWDKTHNIFLEYLFDAGVIGLLAFLFLLGAVFYEAWATKPLPIFFIIGLIAYIIQGLVVFDTLGVYLMLGMFLAYIDAGYKTLNPKI